jgi:hypothetical protein
VLLLTGSLIRAQSFPTKFIGHWHGELLWYKQGNDQPQKVPMLLIIAPSDTANGQYTWHLIYGDNKQDDRPYILKSIDSSKGHWVVDEGDGILLHEYWVANRFTSAFNVQGATIITSYWIEGDNLIIEFYSLDSKQLMTSGGTGKDVPVVDSYKVKGYQKAVLKRG